MADKSDFKLEAEMDRKSKFANWLFGTIALLVILFGINKFAPDYFKLGIDLFLLVVFLAVAVLLYCAIIYYFSYKLLSYVKHILLVNAAVVLHKLVFFLFGVMLVFLGTWLCYELFSTYFLFGVENLEILSKFGATNDSASNLVLQMSGFFAVFSFVAHSLVSIFNKPDNTYNKK